MYGIKGRGVGLDNGRKYGTGSTGNVSRQDCVLVTWGHGPEQVGE